MRPLLIILNTSYMGIPWRIPTYTLKNPPESRLTFTHTTLAENWGKVSPAFRNNIIPQFRVTEKPDGRCRASSAIKQFPREMLMPSLDTFRFVKTVFRAWPKIYLPTNGRYLISKTALSTR